MFLTHKTEFSTVSWKIKVHHVVLKSRQGSVVPNRTLPSTVTTVTTANISFYQYFQREESDHASRTGERLFNRA